MLTPKILLPVIGLAVLAIAGCQPVAKTSDQAPDSAASQIDAPKTDTAKPTENDATSKVRRDQLNSDIRAREQRNNAVNKGGTNRSDTDLASEVRSKLEVNLPASALAVITKEGAVVVTGTVPTQAQFDRIVTLAKEIKGVMTVNMKVVVAPAAPK